MAITKAESGLADTILEDLSLNYQVTVVKDWGEATGEGVDEVWRGGEWSMNELQILRRGISDLASAMRGAQAFISNLGDIVARIHARATEMDVLEIGVFGDEWVRPVAV